MAYYNDDDNFGWRDVSGGYYNNGPMWVLFAGIALIIALILGIWFFSGGSDNKIGFDNTNTNVTNVNRR